MLSDEEVGPPPSEPPSDDDAVTSPSYHRRRSSDLPTSLLPKLLREGWFEKQERGDNKVWRRRWFTLTTTRLVYYKHQRMGSLEESSVDSVEQGEVPLHMITTVTTSKGKGNNKRSHILTIEVPGRKYVLSGESDKYVSNWRKDIDDILQSGSYNKRIERPPPLEDAETGQSIELDTNKLLSTKVRLVQPSVSTNGRTFTSVTSDASSMRLEVSAATKKERAATASNTKGGVQLSYRKLKDIKTKPASPVKVGSKAPTPSKISTSSSNPRPEFSKKPRTPSSTPGGGGGINDRLIRKKMTPARLEHFVAWINEMGLWSDEITSENLYTCMQSGVLLCNIIATYIPDDSLQGVYSRALSKATALSNIEKGLTTLWHKKKVSPSLMPSAVSVYEGNKKAVDDLLQEIFITCVMEDLSKRFEKDIRKINQLLTLFGVPLRGEAMKFPYNTLWDQLYTCSSLVCLLQFAIDNAQLDDDIDPNAIPASQIYRRAYTPRTELHNRDAFFSLMAMVNLPIILTYDNFQSKTTAVDFLQYQLHLIFSRFSAISTFLSGSPSPALEAPFIRRDIFLDENEGEDFDIIPSGSYDTAGDRDSNSAPDDGEDGGSSSSDNGEEVLAEEVIEEEEVTTLTFEQYFAKETECLKLRDDLLNELNDAEEIARYLSKREIELFNMEQSLLVQQMALEAEMKYYGPALGYSLPQSEPTSPTATPGSTEDIEGGRNAREQSLGSRVVDRGGAPAVSHAETLPAISGSLKGAPLHSYRSATGADGNPSAATESARENGGFHSVSYTAPLHVDDEAEILDYISQFNKQETYQILKVMHQPTSFYLKENTSYRPLSFYIAVGDDDMLYLHWEPPLSSTGNEAEELAEASMERGRLPMKSVGKLRKNKDGIVIEIKFTLDDVGVLRGTKGLDTITMVTDDLLLCHRYFLGLHLAKNCFAFSNPSVAKELLHFSDDKGRTGGVSVREGSTSSKTNPINSEKSTGKINPQPLSVVTRFRGQTSAEEVLNPVSSELTRGVSNSISSHLLKAANKSAGVNAKGFV